jgi:hypothetical protein
MNYRLRHNVELVDRDGEVFLMSGGEPMDR